MFSADDLNLAQVGATLDGAPFTSGDMVSDEGTHTLVVSATDLAGNSAAETRSFTVDRTAPVLSLESATPSGPYVQGTLTLTAVADDNLKGIGSLAGDVAVSATGPGGVPVTPTSLTPSTLGDGRRHLVATFDTTAIGDGAFTARFDIADRAANQAAQLAVSRTLDNTPPEVGLDPIGSGPTLGYTSDPTPALSGAVTTGGSPVTVEVEVGAAGSQVATLGAGTWTYQVPAALADGTHGISVSAHDAAGNHADMVLGTLHVDSTGPTLALQASPVDDERAYALQFAGMSVAYIDPGADNNVDLAGAGGPHELGKFVTRLGDAATNPIRWVADASDASGVGVADAGATVEYRVYRAGQTPPSAWTATTAISHTGGVLRVQADALSPLAPALLSHTGDFTIELRAYDHLGNLGASISGTWNHHPLAPPLEVAFASGPPAAGHVLYGVSIAQVGLRAETVSMSEAIAGGGEAWSRPTGVAAFTVQNVHDAPVRAGFFLPHPVGATYTRRVIETNPWNGTLPLDYHCGQYSHTAWHKLPEGTCKSAGFVKPGEASEDAADQALAAGFFELRAYDTSVSPMQPLARITAAQGGQMTITVGSVTYDYYEYDLPARIDASTARVVTVVPSIIGFDLWNPLHAPQQPSQQTLFDGTEITGARYTDWVDCTDTTPVDVGGFLFLKCVNQLGRRQHYRALAEAGVEIAEDALVLNGRTRATGDALFEIQPNFADGVVKNLEFEIDWQACEATGAGSCQPDLPTADNTSW